MIQLSITFPHDEKFPPTITKKVIFETLSSGGKYKKAAIKNFS